MSTLEEQRESTDRGRDDRIQASVELRGLIIKKAIGHGFTSAAAQTNHGRPG